MKILFWNLQGKNSISYIKNLLLQWDIDIAVFAEYMGIDLVKMENYIDGYRVKLSMGGCEKIVLLYRDIIKIDIKREQHRYSIYLCEYLGEKMIIAGVHLPSNPHSNSDDRKNVIYPFARDIEEAEKNLNTEKTVIIGDFNCSPFDSEMTQKNMLNAVLFKELIKKRKFDIYQGRRYKRFYNPMLDYISEKSCTYGSWHYSQGGSTLHWYCYDQVLVRGSLAEKITDLKYCKEINGKSILTKSGYPNKKISDHLPLIVEVELNDK